MAFSLSNLASKFFGSVNWVEEAQKGVTVAESLGPLLMKTAVDGYNAAKGSGSLMTVLSDIENDLPALEAAFKQNNAQVAAQPEAEEVPQTPAPAGEPQP